MELEKKISVVLPIYKGMPLLIDSVQSVLNQTYKNFELLIGNDCVDDDQTNEYLNTLIDSRLTIFNHDTNLGLFKNLNFLIGKSSGEIIHLWSQDDVMLPICLVETVKFHSTHPDCGYIFSRVIYINHNSKIINKMGIQNQDFMSIENHTITSLVSGSVPGNIANVSICKKRFLEYGLFNENLHYSGDFDMWCRLAANRQVGIIQKHLIKLRRHDGQLSRDPKMWIFRLKENRKIYNTLLLKLSHNKKKYALRGIKWKVNTQYLSLLISLIRSRQYKLVKEYLIELRQLDNIWVLFMRWSILKMSRFIGKDKYLLKKIYYQKLWN